MRIVELTKEEFRSNDIRGRGILLESQNFGQDEDLRFRVGMGKEAADFFSSKGIGREVEDTGRTAGFWQNLGGEGVYRPDAVNSLHFPTRLATQLKMSPEGLISIEGETWVEIMNNVPRITEAAKDLFDLREVADEQPSTTKRTKRIRNNKKQA